MVRLAYPRSSTIAYLRAHQNSKCVPPVLIHRDITCDSFKVLAQKGYRRSCMTITKKDPKSYFLTCPRGKMFAPLYSTLRYLWFDMQQQDYVCTYVCSEDFGPIGATHPWPCPPRGYIKILPILLQSTFIGLSPVNFRYSSLNGLGAIVWHYRRTYGRTDDGYQNIPACSSKSAGITDITNICSFGK